MIYDYYTGQLISDTVPDFLYTQTTQPNYWHTWYAYDLSPYDTLTNWFYYDGANYFYIEEDRGAIDFSANPVFNGTLFTPIDELVNMSQIQGGGTLGTGNFAADQGIALTNGILAGGDPSWGAANQSIVNNGGLQNLPLGGFGSNF